MMNPFEEANHLPIPECTPYVGHERFEFPKEVFKQVVRKLRQREDVERPLRCADIACANGEMLYLFKQEFPNWQLHGYDITPEFIECGRAFPGLEGIRLDVKDMYDLDEKFDVVTFIGLMHAMWDPEPPLEKLLSLVAEGGLLLIDACFNPYDVDVRMVFRDDSVPQGRDRWRQDFSQHSRRRISALLENRCASFEFDDVEMGVTIPRKPDTPHCNVWTFEDADGRILVTNGTGMILNKTLLTVRL